LSLLKSKRLRQEKSTLNQIEKVPVFLSEMESIRNAREEADKVLVPLNREMRKELKLRRIRGRMAMEPLAIKLPEELPASMRQLAPEGNLVTDRFRNLIERGAIDIGTRKILSAELQADCKNKMRNARTKIKMIEKNSYKDF
jgi:nucleolar protein 53